MRCTTQSTDAMDATTVVFDLQQAVPKERKELIPDSNLTLVVVCVHNGRRISERGDSSER